MKQNASSGFTLVEMLVVMFIIGVLAALILGIGPIVHKQSVRARTEGEIHALAAACDAYKGEHGSYPTQDSVTQGTPSGTPPGETQSAPPLTPMRDGNPAVGVYKKASQYLYGELAGDADFKGTHGPGSPTVYYPFHSDQIAWTPGVPRGTAGAVSHIKDPFGNCYGYSTAAACDEQIYALNLQADPAATRPAARGFNSTFDLWSTGGRADTAMGDPASIWPAWVKNW